MKPIIVPFFISHLGCPHRCVFCDQVKIAGAASRLPKAVELLRKTAEYAQSGRGRKVEIAFYGGTFTALPLSDQESLLAPFRPLLRSRVVTSIRVSTRPDAVDPEVAAFLKNMGVETVELGVQSMDEEVLRLSRRGHTAGDVEAAIPVLKDAGLSVGIQVMPGLPGDTRERSLASLQKVLALKPSFLRIYPTLVISGTGLAELNRDGDYEPQSLDEAVSLCKRMLLEAKRCDVPVIRLGLQPTAELESPGTVLAGPYHPAFGQLVESELCFDLLCYLAAQVPKGSEVDVRCPLGRVSDVVGQKSRNAARLAERYGVRVRQVEGSDSLEAGALSLAWDGGKVSADWRVL